jgi:thiol-disulfide isomerase/thioredoxin
MSDELVRLILAAGIAALVVVAVVVGRRLYARLLSRHTGAAVGDLADRYGLQPGETTVLYFWTERCAQCVQLQEPALEQLAGERGVSIRKLHAPKESDVLNRFNIATVPSTIVVGPDLRVRKVNVGFADQETLQQQLA